MNKTFKDYNEANRAAQELADTTRIRVGLRYCTYDKTWVLRYLPRKDKCFGEDLKDAAYEPFLSSPKIGSI